MQASFANVTQRTTDWQSVNWRKAHRMVRNLRQRIFKATRQLEWKRVRNLQWLLLKSYSNMLIAVRRVTQINPGKRTAGIDKLLVKTGPAKAILVDALKQWIPWKPLAARRVYIPKSNGKHRPLGIPSIIDRCLQAMVKAALEPCWETQFEPISYGFRPGRSAQDAIARIYVSANPSGHKKWVLDADISGCFDHIDHDFLLQQVGNFPARGLIAQWLKAGYVENGVLHSTAAGTPQGGVISPLLANIALHGMESALGITRYADGTIKKDVSKRIVRYADDFVVLCDSQAEAEQAQVNLQQFLSLRGLKLSEEKTRIVHLSEGFDFLGFNIRHYPSRTARTGWKLLIKPAQKSVSTFREKLRQTFKRLQGSNAMSLIKVLNPMIRGWANYYRGVASSKTFSKLGYYIFWKLRRWISKTHPNKSYGWRDHRYWGEHPAYPGSRWCFVDKDTGMVFYRIGSTRIQRHVLIQGDASPDNPDLRDYFEQRNQRSRQIGDYPKAAQQVIQLQQALCPNCGQSLFNQEEVHIHHQVPRRQGGTNHASNLMAVHMVCHLQLHR
ncbi:group II intron reverse transcriptase/maturase [Leptolyngbya sp. 'hensonii']|uniref:group II intron reverse transcriptase/maturase n=1 Tax=Leptolyngbya sp. 'hensonii' TaxID=1922337 RepID=UPI0009500F10|nr:group II intron reverse transcriptase/maturase [Leptolyngbya sp. 'hensonii']OLP15621.1 group II intron reverse transcriptase/maturase [Leptolyngbya sp. 'hensonii']